MQYTPPNGNAIDFKLIGSYIAPAGNAINFDLLGGIQLTLDSSLENSSAYFTLLHSISEREATFSSFLQNVSPSILIKPNDGIGYEVSSTVVFNFKDSAYFNPNAAVVPFQFNLFTVNLGKINFNVVTDSSTADISGTGVPDNSLAFQAEDATAYFEADFKELKFGTLSSNTGNVSKSISLRFTAPITGTLSKTLSNATASINAVCIAATTVDILANTGSVSSSVSLKTAIALDATLSSSTSSPIISIIGKVPEPIDGVLLSNTGSATYRQWLTFKPPYYLTLGFNAANATAHLSIIFVKTKPVYLDAITVDSIASFLLRTVVRTEITLSITTAKIEYNCTGFVKLPISVDLRALTSNSIGSILGTFPVPISASILGNTGKVSPSFQLFRHPPTSGNLDSTVSVNTFANILLLKQNFGRLSSILSDANSRIVSVTIVGTLVAITSSVNLRGIGSVSYGMWSSYLASVKLYSLFYQLSGRLNSTTFCKSDIRLVTPLHAKADFSAITPNAISEILIRVANPVSVTIAIVTPDVTMKMMREISNSLPSNYRLIDLEHISAHKKDFLFVLDKETSTKTFVNPYRLLDKEVLKINVDILYLLKASREEISILELILYKVLEHEFPINITKISINNLLDKEISQIYFKNFYSILEKEGMEVPKSLIYQALTSENNSRQLSNIYNIVERAVVLVNRDFPYSIDSYVEKVIEYLETHQLDIFKEKDISFSTLYSLSSLVLKDIEFLSTNVLETVQEKEITFQTVYDIYLPQEFDTSFFLSYGLDSETDEKSLISISYFGESRNRFDSVEYLESPIYSSKRFYIASNQTYEAFYQSWTVATTFEYSLDTAENRYMSFIQEYLSTYDKSFTLYGLSYDLPSSDSVIYPFTVSSENSLHELDSFNVITSDALLAKGDVLFHLIHDLDSKESKDLIFDIDYSLESPSVSVLKSITEDCSSMFRLFSETGAVLKVVTESIKPLFEISVKVYNLVRISSITSESYFEGTGYHVVRVNFKSIAPDIITNIVMAGFYSRLSSEVSSCESDIKIYTRAEIILKGILDTYPSITTARIQLLSSSLTRLTFFVSTESIKPFITGIGHSVARLFVSGDPDSKYNVITNSKTEYYWYALGIKFDGLLFQPVSLTLDPKLDSVKARFVIKLAEHIYANMSTILQDSTSKVKIRIPIYLKMVNTLDEIKLNLSLKYFRATSEILIKPDSVKSEILLKTITRTEVSLVINTPSSTSSFILRTECIGKLTSTTSIGKSNIVLAHTAGTLYALVYASARIEARIPFYGTMLSKLDNIVTKLRLSNPESYTVFFTLSTESISGGFKAVTKIVGTLNSTTQFVIPRVFSPSETGTLISHLVGVEPAIYIKHRDAQISELFSNLESITSDIKIYVPSKGVFRTTLRNDFMMGSGKVPEPLTLSMKVITQSANVSIRLHNSKITLITFEKKTEPSKAIFRLYHPIAFSIKALLQPVYPSIKLEIPIRIDVSLLLKTESSSSIIKAHIPVYGTMDMKTPLVIPRIKALTFYLLFRNTLEKVKPDIKILTIVHITCKMLIKVSSDTSISIKGKIDAAGLIDAKTANSSALIRLNSFVPPPSYELNLTGDLSSVVSKFLLSNPTNGMRIDGGTEVFALFKTVIPTLVSANLETNPLRDLEVFLNHKATSCRLQSILQPCSSDFSGYIRVLGYITIKPSNISLNLLIDSSHTRHGNIDAFTKPVSCAINIMSIINHFTGTLSSNLENIKFPYIYGKVPYRTKILVDAVTNPSLFSAYGKGSLGGRLKSTTDKIDFTFISLNINAVVRATTPESISSIKLLNPRIDAYFRIVAEPVKVSIKGTALISARISTVTADLRLFQFVVAKNIYGKLVAYDHLVGEPLDEFSDPRWLGLYTLEQLQGFRNVQHDMLKTLEYVKSNINLYTPVPTLVTMNLNLGYRPNNPSQPGHIGYDNPPFFEYNGPDAYFSDAGCAFKGSIPIWGTFIISEWAFTTDCVFKAFMKIFTLTVKSSLDKVKTDLKLRHGGYEGLFNVFTDHTNFYLVARTTMPGYFKAATASCISNIFVTAPFHATLNIRSSLESVRTNIIGEVRLYKWAFMFGVAEDSNSDFNLRVNSQIKTFDIITEDIKIKFELICAYYALTFVNKLPPNLCSIKLKYNPFSRIGAYLYPETEKCTADIRLNTNAYSIFNTSTNDSTALFYLVAATPKQAILFGYLDKCLMDIRVVTPIRAYLDGALQTVLGDINLDYKIPISARFNITTDSERSSIICSVPTRITIETATDTILFSIKLVYQTFGTIDLHLETIQIDSRINVYDIPAEVISDVYYSIEGDIIPDSSSKTFDKQGFIRVYDGNTGEVILQQFVDTTSYKVSNLIEGEYAVVYDPQSERRLKTHTTVHLGEE